MKRGAGILLPVSSLPSKYGIGCFDKSAYHFIDWLKKAGQSYWQILPLGITGYGNSPYQSFSSFAGNPYYIDIDQFVADGLLSKQDCEDICSDKDTDNVNYEKLYYSRYKLLRTAFANFSGKDSEICRFVANNPWIDDYSLFMAVKQTFNGAPVWQWDDDIRLRIPATVERYKKELQGEIEFHKFIQYHFYKQWYELKRYANKNDVRIIGDIPIYAAADSVDVWVHPELFQLDKDNRPIAVAGCPPDGFSADGQLWGNPVYNWDTHKSDDYRWWVSRLEHCFRIYDILRIDHFRGFDEYFSIPFGGSPNTGHWEKGPGAELFQIAKSSLGTIDVIAEDLGFMTDSVKRLVEVCGFPNMKVLEFAFDSRDTGNSSEHLPHNYNNNCVAYTGTHDNQTIVSWFSTITDIERQQVRDYICDDFTPDCKINIPLISVIMRSCANLCVIPMQDWLGLTDKSRMNTPSTVGRNWQWRVKKEELSDDLADKINKLTKMYDR